MLLRPPRLNNAPPPTLFAVPHERPSCDRIAVARIVRVR
ncbi:hypothetical protein FTUN_2727 [Frigoriglobus tundricola]|uniref:Uncharacterized protein n=1 Tax=Frigoriglobus tundricola TaxID=2774151 RepID=A0A6M5YMN1_9BACT|nr:hypothetical protein FTUN_2727 [Frigoriglobus tundricola]